MLDHIGLIFKEMIPYLTEAISGIGLGKEHLQILMIIILQMTEDQVKRLVS